MPATVSRQRLALRTPLCAIVVVVAVLAIALGSPPQTDAARVDGISDQSLPAWEGSFAASAFARQFGRTWAGGPASGIALARYVVQWDAALELSSGADPNGDYRERFEAWLADVRALRLTPVLALTSFDADVPAGSGAYLAALERLLAIARTDGEPIRFVEPWNEPNGQGREDAPRAALQADAAEQVCSEGQACEVVAGDLEDAPAAPAYAAEYERRLTFRPSIWGIHAYRSVALHSDAPALRLRDALPAGGAGTQLWLTEVAALYCNRGVTLGEASQASDAAFLADDLSQDPRLAPAHVFYYGFMAGDRQPARCEGGGGADGELYAADGSPRPAAAVIFHSALGLAAGAFGPAPGSGWLAG